MSRGRFVADWHEVRRGKGSMPDATLDERQAENAFYDAGAMLRHSDTSGCGHRGSGTAVLGAVADRLRGRIRRGIQAGTRDAVGRAVGVAAGLAAA